MGLGEDNCLLAVFFSKQGDYLRHEAPEIEVILPSDMPPGKRRYQTTLLKQDALAEWQRKLGLTPGEIRVRKFFLDDGLTGSRDMPEAYYWGNAHRASLTEAQERQLDHDFLEWLREKRFIVWWGKEYWMNDKGDIIAT
jgi:hypothetical protein